MAIGREPPVLGSWDCEVWHLRRKKADAARDVKDLCERTMVENSYKATRAYRFASHYEGFSLTNLAGYGADVNVTTASLPGWDSPLIKNRLPGLVQNFVAKSFANDDVLPQFTTQGGDYEQQLKAETLDQLITTDFGEEHGQFGNIHELQRMGGTIAAAATGRYYVFAIDYDNLTKPEAELDDSLTVGVYRTQRYGAVRMLCRTVFMLPEEAIRRFGKKHREKIYQNLEPRSGVFVAGKGVGDIDQLSMVQRREVRVHMAWAVQCGKEPGRQMFVLKDGQTILRDRVYTKDKPPCVHWDFRQELSGEGGTPLTQQVYLLSRFQNRILNDVDTAERKTSQVIIAVQRGTEGAKAITSQVVNAKAVQVIEVDGPVDSAMKIFEAPKFSKDSLALERVYDDAQYEDTGISRGGAQGLGSKGATSGIQESLKASYYTEHFADAERRSIQMRAIGTSKILLWVEQRLADKGFERWVGDNKFRQLVRSVDLDLDEDKYVLEIKPVSEGKDTPASRLEKAEKWLNNPAVEFNGTNMVEMFKSFDIDALRDKIDSIGEWVEEQVERWRKAPASEMAKPGFYLGPQRWMQMEQLQAALLTVTLAYLRALQDQVPQARIAWYEKFGNEATVLIQSEQARLAALKNGTAPPPPPPIGAVTQGPGGPPPGGQPGAPPGGPPGPPLGHPPGGPPPSPAASPGGPPGPALAA
jgi:hypothetical protein